MMAAMKGKGAKRANTVVLDDSEEEMKGQLKDIGGSKSDHWNLILVNQALSALWTKNSNAEERDRQSKATIRGMIGIAPKDELEGMMARSARAYRCRAGSWPE